MDVLLGIITRTILFSDMWWVCLLKNEIVILVSISVLCPFILQKQTISGVFLVTVLTVFDFSFFSEYLYVI
jgi:hypothetical protein